MGSNVSGTVCAHLACRVMGDTEGAAGTNTPFLSPERTGDVWLFLYELPLYYIRNDASRACCSASLRRDMSLRAKPHTMYDFECDPYFSYIINGVLKLSLRSTSCIYRWHWDGTSSLRASEYQRNYKALCSSVRYLVHVVNNAIRIPSNVRARLEAGPERKSSSTCTSSRFRYCG
jgi:hypothetical protein